MSKMRDDTDLSGKCGSCQHYAPYEKRPVGVCKIKYDLVWGVKMNVEVPRTRKACKSYVKGAGA